MRADGRRAGRARGATRAGGPPPSASPRAGASGRTALGAGLLFVVFSAAALGVYAPALAGPFVSDDVIYLTQNPFVQRGSLDDWIAIWSPTSALPGMVENYAPLHLSVHALQWQAFGERTTGYHVTNVLVHALACALFAALLRRHGVGAAASAAAGAFLLLHPANVEAVAWISQLKSTGALALALMALLAFPRRGALSAALFGLALLMKPTAIFALPVAAWWRFGCRTQADAAAFAAAEGAGGARRDAAWLVVWGALLVAFLVAELSAFHTSAGHLQLRYPDLATRVRTVLALAGRYLALSASGAGASAFHEPEVVAAWSDPWLLGAIPALALLAVRFATTVRARSVEAGYWIWAVASFAPVSQVFPFLYPMADRYLYFILPGLVGGVVLAARELAPPRLVAARGARIAAIALTAALLVSFAARSVERARIWSSPVLVVADAAKHYPGGISARQLEARRLAQQRDVAGAVAALRAAYARGYNRFEALLLDPGYAPLRGKPEFEALVGEMAGFWVERIRSAPEPSQTELHFLAQAHVARGEREEAISVLERAAAAPGPIADVVQRDLTALRAQRSGAR